MKSFKEEFPSLKNSIIDIIRSSKNYNHYNIDELKLQYYLIMQQYDDFKKKMLYDIKHNFTNSKLEDIKNKQISIQQKMNRKALSELDEHLSIIKNLIDNY